MNPIPESELILNPDGSIYHLNIRPDMIADTIITVGDPERVSEVSKYFDSIECKVAKREFVTHTGYLNNKRLSVLSTGIGTDNIDIVLNELDACANIDFKTRIPNPIHKSLKIIRVGTSGSLQNHIALDDIIVSSHGIGLDNLANFYLLENDIEETFIIEKFKKEVLNSPFTSSPYIAKASKTLINTIGKGYKQGITLTCPGFYGPQGRKLRLTPRFQQLNSNATKFIFEQHQITNFEMETAGIYAMGELLGHECLSVSVIMAHRIQNTFSKTPTQSIQKMIEEILEKVSTL
ncbi:MAG: nucleoside phosphorylase [Bacteroidota bacterium]